MIIDELENCEVTETLAGLVVARANTKREIIKRDMDYFKERVLETWDYKTAHEFMTNKISFKDGMDRDR